GPLDLTVPADVYDIDGAQSTAADVARLHAARRYAVCYVNVGAIEDFRADAGAIPRHLIGKPNGWPRERLLALRRPAAVDLVLAARRRDWACKEWGAVDAGVVGVGANARGFAVGWGVRVQVGRQGRSGALALALVVVRKNDAVQVTDLVAD